MEAILIDKLSGVRVKVHDTTDHTMSSYGQPVWVDDDDNAYCQVGLESPAMYGIVKLTKTNDK